MFGPRVLIRRKTKYKSSAFIPENSKYSIALWRKVQESTICYYISLPLQVNMKIAYIRVGNGKKATSKSNSTGSDQSRPLIYSGAGSNNTPAEKKIIKSELKKQIFRKNMKEYNF